MQTSSLIKPLKLGNTLFPNNVIQGPLAGVSCSPFRLLTHRYSQPAYTCTEMISCKTLIHKPLYTQQRFLNKDPEEGPVCFQLSGSDTTELAKATAIAHTLGADLIDLNCGCPVKKIRKKGAGSRLLTQPEKLYQLIRAMKDNTDRPVSVKIRVEGNTNDIFNAEVADAVESAGTDFLVVHGRHWTEHYETACHYDDIAFFVNRLNIPVIGNGDIADIASLKKMLQTGCAGAMIGRYGVGQPWLIKQLMAEANNQPFQLPASKEIGDYYIEHITRLSTLLKNEKAALLQARKLSKYYARQLTDRATFCLAIQHCENISALADVVKTYFAHTIDSLNKRSVP